MKHPKYLWCKWETGSRACSRLGVSKCGEWVSSISITWELVENRNSYYSRLTEQDILGMWPSSLCFIKVSRRYWCPSLSTADWTNGTCSHIIVKGTQRLLPFLTAVFWLLHLCKANAFLVNHSSEEGRAGPEGCQHCAFCHLTPL